MVKLLKSLQSRFLVRVALFVFLLVVMTVFISATFLGSDLMSVAAHRQQQQDGPQQEGYQPPNSRSGPSSSPSSSSSSSPSPSPSSSSLPVKGKCVVIVSLHSCSRPQALPEWNNLAHFLSHAYIPANTATVMYSSVEYLFLTNIDGVARPIRDTLLKQKEKAAKEKGRGNSHRNSSNTSSNISTRKKTGANIDAPMYYTVSDEVPNVRIVVTPKAAADLNMVQYVFPELFARDPTIANFVVLNSGARGPLLPPEIVVDGGAIRSSSSSSSLSSPSSYYWVDVVGGERLVEHMRRLMYPPPPPPPAAAVNSTFSTSSDAGKEGGAATAIRKERNKPPRSPLSLPPAEVIRYAEESIGNNTLALLNRSYPSSHHVTTNYSKLVVGVLMSKQVRLHLQSYFMSLPPMAAKEYYAELLTFPVKNDFINKVEVVVPDRMRDEGGFVMYAMGQGYSYEAAGRLIRGGGNPTFGIQCPLCCMFPKYGGRHWKEGRFHALRVMETVEHITLTMHQNAQRRLKGSPSLFSSMDLLGNGTAHQHNSSASVPATARGEPQGYPHGKHQQPSSFPSDDAYPLSVVQRRAALLIEAALRTHWCPIASATLNGATIPTPAIEAAKAQAALRELLRRSAQATTNATHIKTTTAP